jgi:hypothetical protein
MDCQTVWVMSVRDAIASDKRQIYLHIGAWSGSRLVKPSSAGSHRWIEQRVSFLNTVEAPDRRSTDGETEAVVSR